MLMPDTVTAVGAVDASIGAVVTFTAGYSIYGYFLVVVVVLDLFSPITQTTLD